MKCSKHNKECNLFVYGKPLCEECCKEILERQKKEEGKK
jgi:hypothetical protein